MIHTIISQTTETKIEIVQDDVNQFVTLFIESTKDGTRKMAFLEPKQLNDFIGTLLHVQSKMRRNNGRR